MMMSAVVAIALGVAPVPESGSPQLVQVDAKMAAQIGRYRQFTDRSGKTHVRGFDRLGRAYDLTIDKNGHVQGQAGNWDVSFDVTDAA